MSVFIWSKITENGCEMVHNLWTAVVQFISNVIQHYVFWVFCQGGLDYPHKWAPG